MRRRAYANSDIITIASPAAGVCPFSRNSAAHIPPKAAPPEGSEREHTEMQKRAQSWAGDIPIKPSNGRESSTPQTGTARQASSPRVSAECLPKESKALRAPLSRGSSAHPPMQDSAAINISYIRASGLQARPIPLHRTSAPMRHGMAVRFLCFSSRTQKKYSSTGMHQAVRL